MPDPAWWALGATGATLALLMVLARTNPFLLRDLTQEGLVETWGTASLAAAAAIFVAGAIAGCVTGQGGAALCRSVGHLAIGSVLLVGVGEELSWGQHLIGYDTPDALDANRQGEANLHNLPPFHELTAGGNRLLTLFCVAYLVALPAAAAVVRPVHRLAARLRVYVPPIGFPLVLLVLLVCVQAVELVATPATVAAAHELKESNLEFILLCVALAATLPGRRPATPGAAPPDGEPAAATA